MICVYRDKVIINMTNVSIFNPDQAEKQTQQPKRLIEFVKSIDSVGGELTTPAMKPSDWKNVMLLTMGHYPDVLDYLSEKGIPIVKYDEDFNFDHVPTLRKVIIYVKLVNIIRACNNFNKNKIKISKINQITPQVVVLRYSNYEIKPWITTIKENTSTPVELLLNTSGWEIFKQSEQFKTLYINWINS